MSQKGFKNVCKFDKIRLLRIDEDCSEGGKEELGAGIEEGIGRVDCAIYKG